MIRTACGALIAFFFLTVGTPMLWIENIKKKRDKTKADFSSLRIVQRTFRGIYKACNVKLTVLGEEKIPKGRPVLYVCNHQSYFDIVIGYTLREELTGYISKNSIAKVITLRKWMERLYCLFLDRENPKDAIRAINEAVEQVEHGISMCVFPEGTRNHSDELLPFKSGLLRIAEKTGCPVVPMAISNTDHIVSDNKPVSKKTPVIIEYGDPIFTEEMSRKERKQLAEITQARIQEILDKNKELL